MDRIISPLTGTEDVSLVSTTCAHQLVDDWKMAFQIDIADELRGYENIDLFQCNATKLKFFLPADIAGTARLYEQLQKFDWFYLQHKWEYKVALQDLKHCKRILEIGSGSGYFIQAALREGLDITGLELNKTAVLEAKEKNLPIVDSDLKEIAASCPEEFDAVCSFQVLEHIPNPKEFIELSLRALKPGGKLIFCVPNSESFLRYEYNLLDMPPHHMTRWSEGVFIAMEKIFPVKVDKIIYEPLSRYHVSEYLRAYANHYTSVLKMAKFIFNRYTFPPLECFLNTGVRKLLRGQSIYVQFGKI
jgi:2-polyprenyl-3-methyl-5-hydroxy-6-metoxy-1,4-benzoquinol methylase